jgi:hypothetical protein
MLRKAFPLPELLHEGNYYLEVILSNTENGYEKHVISIYAKGTFDQWQESDLDDWILSEGSIANVESNSLNLVTNTSKIGSLAYHYNQAANQKISVLWNPGNATGHNSYYSYIRFGNIAEIRFYGQVTKTEIVIKNLSIYTVDNQSGRESDRTIQFEYNETLNYVKIVYVESGHESHTYEINTDDIQVELDNISIGFNTPRLPSWTNKASIKTILIDSEEYEEKQVVSTITYYSEVFCCTNQLDDCLEIEYWNKTGDFVLKNGLITFQDDFRFKLYLKSELGKPEYNFEEEATKRLGYSFIESQVSKKVYKFNTIIPEYICDAMRLIRLCSNKTLKSKGETYDMLTFDMEVDWQQQGDLASVTCEFETDNVLVNLGGLIPEELGGDFRNSHYNDDFDNQ